MATNYALLGDSRGLSGDGEGLTTSGTTALSLYTRVVVVNAGVLIAAVLALALTPLSVPSPTAVDQALVLVVGVASLVLADAMLLRSSFSGLSSLAQRMSRVDLLQPEDRLPETGTREARALIAGFNSMLDRLEEDRRDSMQRTVAALEDERRRIGRELHDEIGQRLTGLLLQLHRVGDDAPEHLRPRIAAVLEDQRAALDEVGALAWQLRPSVLDDLGLIRALEALVSAYADDAEHRIACMLPAEALPPMGPHTELTVYRVAQEAVTNAVRHSGATSIDLRVAVSPERLSLLVTDNGNGHAPMREGSGIRGMRERALLIGARLSIDPGERGWRVRLDVPRSQLLQS